MGAAVAGEPAEPITAPSMNTVVDMEPIDVWFSAQADAPREANDIAAVAPTPVPAQPRVVPPTLAATNTKSGAAPTSSLDFSHYSAPPCLHPQQTAHLAGAQVRIKPPPTSATQCLAA